MKAFLNALLMLLYAVPAASAAISSLGLPSIDHQAGFSYNQWLATSIEAAAESPAMLVDSITLKLSCAGPNQYVFVAVTGTEGGRPNLNDIRVIADTAPLLAPMPLNALVTLTLQPRVDAGPPVLVPGEQYWLVLGVSLPDWEEALPAGLFHWSYASAGGGTQSQDGWTVGGSVGTSGTGGQGWSIESGTPYTFEMAVSPVPEPGALAVSLVALATLTRRRRPCAA